MNNASMPMQRAAPIFPLASSALARTRRRRSLDFNPSAAALRRRANRLREKPLSLFYWLAPTQGLDRSWTS